jgi:ankyrin repeat protein
VLYDQLKFTIRLYFAQGESNLLHLTPHFLLLSDIAATMTNFTSLTNRLSRGHEKGANPGENLVGVLRADYHATNHQRQKSQQKTSLALFGFELDSPTTSKNKEMEVEGYTDRLSPIDPALQDFDPHDRLSTDFTYSYSSELPQLPHPIEHNRSSTRFSHRLSSVLSRSPPGIGSKSRKSNDLTELLCTAAATGDTQYIGRILGAGGDLSKRNTDGLSPLHVAAMSGQGESVRCLVRMGAPIGAKDSQGYTALHRAVLNRHVHIIPHLTNLGADINEKTVAGKTSLHLAASLPSEEATFSPTRSSTPSSTRSSNLRFSYVFSGTDLARRPSYGSASSAYDDCSTIEALIRAGADKERRDKNGETALHIAVRAGDTTNARTLLDLGAAINVTNSTGVTPLGLLAEQREVDPSLSELLFSKGAIVTPLQEKTSRRTWIGRAAL